MLLLFCMKIHIVRALHGYSIYKNEKCHVQDIVGIQNYFEKIRQYIVTSNKVCGILFGQRKDVVFC